MNRSETNIEGESKVQVEGENIMGEEFEKIMMPGPETKHDLHDQYHNRVQVEGENIMGEEFEKIMMPGPETKHDLHDQYHNRVQVEGENSMDEEFENIETSETIPDQQYQYHYMLWEGATYAVQTTFNFAWYVAETMVQFIIYYILPNVEEKKPVQWDDKLDVEGAINKRTLAKFMIKECGHEGAENTRAQQYLRKLVQGCIDDLQKHPDIDWADASLEISGFDGKQYLIVTGEGKQRIYAMLDEEDQVCIIKK